MRKMKELSNEAIEELDIINTHPRLSNRIKKALEYRMDIEFQEKPIDLEMLLFLESIDMANAKERL